MRLEDLNPGETLSPAGQRAVEFMKQFENGLPTNASEIAERLDEAKVLINAFKQPGKPLPNPSVLAELINTNTALHRLRDQSSAKVQPVEQTPGIKAPFSERLRTAREQLDRANAGLESRRRERNASTYRSSKHAPTPKQPEIPAPSARDNDPQILVELTRVANELETLNADIEREKARLETQNARFATSAKAARRYRTNIDSAPNRFERHQWEAKLEAAEKSMREILLEVCRDKYNQIARLLELQEALNKELKA